MNYATQQLGYDPANSIDATFGFVAKEDDKIILWNGNDEMTYHFDQLEDGIYDTLLNADDCFAEEWSNEHLTIINNSVVLKSDYHHLQIAS